VLTFGTLFGVCVENYVNTEAIDTKRILSNQYRDYENINIPAEMWFCGITKWSPAGIIQAILSALGGPYGP